MALKLSKRLRTGPVRILQPSPLQPIEFLNKEAESLSSPLTAIATKQELEDRLEAQDSVFRRLIKALKVAVQALFEDPHNSLLQHAVRVQVEIIKDRYPHWCGDSSTTAGSMLDLWPDHVDSVQRQRLVAFCSGEPVGLPVLPEGTTDNDYFAIYEYLLTMVPVAVALDTFAFLLEEDIFGAGFNHQMLLDGLDETERAIQSGATHVRLKYDGQTINAWTRRSTHDRCRQDAWSLYCARTLPMGRRWERDETHWRYIQAGDAVLGIAEGLVDRCVSYTTVQYLARDCHQAIKDHVEMAVIQHMI